MATVSSKQLISVEDYLAGELVSKIKHEYLGGVLHAMAGARNVHNNIATNLTRLLYKKDSRRSCRPYNSDTKIRIHMSTHMRFYYPDASVICDPNPPQDSYQDHPVLIAEVLSRKTRRIDETEKKDAYLTIPSLSVYLLVEQDAPLVTLFRRNEIGGFDREIYEGMDTVIPLAEIDTQLSIADVFEGVTFTPEPDEDDEAG